MMVSVEWHDVGFNALGVTNDYDDEWSSLTANGVLEEAKS